MLSSTASMAAAINQEMAANTQINESDDYWFALWGLAEYFRQQNPPHLRFCIHCLMTIISSKPPPVVEARSNLQLGSLLLKHTKNYDAAIAHLERASQLCRSINGFTDCYFESCLQLSQALILKGKVPIAINCLQSVHQEAGNSPYWSCRILLKLAQTALDDGNSKAAVYYLTMGEESAARFGANFVRIIFKLGHGMLLLVQRDFGGVDGVLGACSQLINAYNDSLRNKEVCKIFFLIMQTCHFLYASQVLTAANPLKQLQDALTSLINLPIDTVECKNGSLSNAHDKFNWLNQYLLHIVVAAVTTMYELQAGRLDRVKRNFDKGMQAIENYKAKYPTNSFLDRLTLIFLENQSQACLSSDKRSLALTHIDKMVSLVSSCSDKAVQRFESRIHVLLGFYYNLMGRIDVADWHFQFIQTGNLEAPSREMGYISDVSRCLLLSKLNRKTEAAMSLQRLDEVIAAGRTNPPAVVRAAREYCIAVLALSQRKPNEARDSLVRAIQISTGDGLNRMGLLSRLLLGFVYLAHQNPNEAREMLEQASHAAKSAGDAELTVVSARMLGECCFLSSRMLMSQGATQQAAVQEQMAQMHNADSGPYTQSLNQDTSAAKSLPEHNNLMMWPQQNLVGSPPHANFGQSSSVSKAQLQVQTQPSMPVAKTHQPQQQNSPRVPNVIQPPGMQQQHSQSYVPHPQAAHGMRAPTNPQIVPPNAQQHLLQQQQQQFLLNSPPGNIQSQQMANQFSPFTPPSMYSPGVPAGLSHQQILHSQQITSAANTSNVYNSSTQYQQQR